NGIDWKAFVAAFQKVQVENEDTELAIQTIENKGDGVIVVKVNVPPGTNKEKIHSDFTQSYELALKEVEKRYKAELKAKDDQIIIYRQQYTDMKEIVSVLASKPVNVEVNNRAESKAMNESNDQSRKIDIGSIGGDFNASGQALNLGSIDISGTVTNTIGQLQESNTSEASQLADLLKQLQAAIEKDENLSKEDKDTALEQVKVLAEEGQKPKDGAMQKAAKSAITMLRGTVMVLPATATLFEACSKLLPLITKLFGLG
ncbi:MAG TPA: hypothetical protein DEV81_15800, partial [Cyanobacteria bacterium UBA11049]|nr:hypothetical protein [Cyanobacteria bacterium UBA11049]